jgi:diguanylate cyclase (GGDEF)-like protein
MDFLSLPDITGMLIMMGVLLWLRRAYRDTRVNLWMIGLTFILIEAIAVAMLRSKEFTQITHVIALDAYVLAGVSFSWAARKEILPGKRRIPLSILPATPLFVLATFYGFDVTKRAAYVYVALACLILGVLYNLFVVRTGVRFRLALVALHLGIWLPILYFAEHGLLRWLVYWGLTCLYLLVALSFRGLVTRDRVGGVVIVAGFCIWAMCFFLHPLARGTEWNGVVSQVWDMQKFFVILGMVLVLLEEQTRRRQDEAMHDPLTSLPNRRLFDDRLTQALERSRRTGLNTALFALDLNGFKDVNDTHGHQTGDMVLIQMANALRSKVRGSDTLARRGGDEFSVIVNDLARREDCERIADALRAAIEGVRLPEGGPAQLTVSIGYALFPEDAQAAVSLCEAADAHMYGRKRQKNRTVTVSA